MDLQTRINETLHGVIAISIDYPKFIELIPDDLLVTSAVKRLLTKQELRLIDYKELVDAVQLHVFTRFVKGDFDGRA